MMDDSSFLSIDSSDNSCVGAPPVESELSSFDESSGDDDDIIIDCAAYDDYLSEPNNFEKSTDQIITDSQSYTSETIQATLQTLLSACLTSYGMKLKSGFTAEEICDSLKELMGLSLESLTVCLLGREKAKLYAVSKHKVDLAQALVKENWLKWENGYFFPIIPKENEDLVAQFIVGAESLEMYKMKKKVKGFASVEDELRAMKTYNFLFKLIAAICTRERQNLVPYQMIIDAYNEMLEKGTFNHIYKEYEPILKFSEFPKLNVNWFKHFTGRTSLLKFCGIHKFSGIVSNNTDSSHFGIRENAVLFKKKDFEELKMKQDTKKGDFEFHDNKHKEKEKKQLQPDPNFKEIIFDEDSDDSKSKQDEVGSEEDCGSWSKRTVGASCAFGGAPRSGNSLFGEQEEDMNREIDVNSDDSYVSSISDGRFSDESEGERQEREMKNREKILRKKKLEQKRNVTKNTDQKSNIPNTFSVSTFDVVDQEKHQKNIQEEEKKKKYFELKRIQKMEAERIKQMEEDERLARLLDSKLIEENERKESWGSSEPIDAFPRNLPQSHNSLNQNSAYRPTPCFPDEVSRPLSRQKYEDIPQYERREFNQPISLYKNQHAVEFSYRNTPETHYSGNSHYLSRPPSSVNISSSVPMNYRGENQSRMSRMGPSRIGYRTHVDRHNNFIPFDDNLNVRIFRFISDFEEDGRNVTDTEFQEHFPYKYKLPPNFVLHQYVNQHLADSIRITTVHVKGHTEYLYNVLR